MRDDARVRRSDSVRSSRSFKIQCSKRATKRSIPNEKKKTMKRFSISFTSFERIQTQTYTVYTHNYLFIISSSKIYFYILLMKYDKKKISRCRDRGKMKIKFLAPIH